MFVKIVNNFFSKKERIKKDYIYGKFFNDILLFIEDNFKLKLSYKLSFSSIKINFYIIRLIRCYDLRIKEWSDVYLVCQNIQLNKQRLDW